MHARYYRELLTRLGATDNIAAVMDRLRSTFKRSRTPTGAEMKTQNSLEVPKQVRSVSFDEIKLGCAKRDEDARKERSAAGSGHGSSGHLAGGQLSASSLRVPVGGGSTSGQRSRSFDSSATAAAADRDDPGVYLEVPSSKLFHRRRSSGEKVSPAAACVHCAYLEELSKMNRSSSGDENQRLASPPPRSVFFFHEREEPVFPVVDPQKQTERRFSRLLKLIFFCTSIQERV